MMERLLTIIEGQGKPINRTVEATRKELLKIGWEVNRIEKIDINKIMDSDDSSLYPEMSDNIWFRCDSGENHVNVGELLPRWADREHKRTIDAHLVGGRKVAADKLCQHGIFSSCDKIRRNVPKIFAIDCRKDVDRLIAEKKIRFPIIIKDRFGSNGKRIYLFKNDKELDKCNKGKWKGYYAVEQYIDSEYEWRVFVIGGVAVGAMRKSGHDDDKYERDFVKKCGGVIREKEEDPQVLSTIYRIATWACAVSGAEYGGCDIIKDKETGRYYILEVNFVAGWRNGFCEITGENLPIILAEWFEERSKLEDKKYSKYDCVKEYIERRLKYLDKKTVTKYEEILGWKWRPKDDNDGMTLGDRIVRVYKRILLGEMSGAGEIIEEVEKTPLCWAGNFIGSRVWGEDGVLEECIVPSACYLAIREKYDKMER